MLTVVTFTYTVTNSNNIICLHALVESVNIHYLLDLIYLTLIILLFYFSSDRDLHDTFDIVSDCFCYTCVEFVVRWIFP